VEAAEGTQQLSFRMDIFFTLNDLHGYRPFPPRLGQFKTKAHPGQYDGTSWPLAVEWGKFRTKIFFIAFFQSPLTQVNK
jgi:hypothetical protein